MASSVQTHPGYFEANKGIALPGSHEKKWHFRVSNCDPNAWKVTHSVT
jgi:hypothetical protein